MNKEKWLIARKDLEIIERHGFPIPKEQSEKFLKKFFALIPLKDAIFKQNEDNT